MKIEHAYSGRYGIGAYITSEPEQQPSFELFLTKSGNIWNVRKWPAWDGLLDVPNRPNWTQTFDLDDNTQLVIHNNRHGQIKTARVSRIIDGIPADSVDLV